MASNFQSSFIPKEPITEEVFKKKKAGFVGVLVVSIFISSIVIAAAMYVYEKIIKDDIQSLQMQLAEAEKSIDKKTINEISLFSKKLTLAKTLVLKHKVISNFLETLSGATVGTVQFSSLSYGNLEKDQLAVSLRGKATSYASIALQEDVFSKEKYFKSVLFSNMNLADQGMVSFDLNILVDPQIALYAVPEI